MIPPKTTVGPVSLIVPDLNRSIRFYEVVLGFKILHQKDDEAKLGTRHGTSLLELTERPTAPRTGRRSPGLFHFAILLPSRAALGRSLIHLVEQGWKLSGAGDHLVSEALYLNDPDGNGIELYADRPRETWQYLNGQVLMDTLAVDLDSLVAEAKNDPSPWTGLPTGTTMGHVHLKVSNLESAGHFYSDIIGFDQMTTMPQALFVAAGGYHHHVGLNTWMSESAPPPPEGALGLDHFTIRVPDQAALDAILDNLTTEGVAYELVEDGASTRDPSQNGVRIVRCPEGISAVNPKTPARRN